ncbi:Unknown protein sequence [Pseudomonas coronafaciens pv. oryzae]|nr:Unknown protein sequence [Pseudomonas coronafaciens pv. oryzae]
MRFAVPAFCHYLANLLRDQRYFTNKRLTGCALFFKPGLGLCCGAYSGHSSKPFKSV